MKKHLLSFKCDSCSKDISFMTLDDIEEVKPSSTKFNIRGDKLDGEDKIFILDDEYLCEECFKEKTNESLLAFKDIIRVTLKQEDEKNIEDVIIDIHIQKIDNEYYFYHVLDAFVDSRLSAFFLLTLAVPNEKYMENCEYKEEKYENPLYLMKSDNNTTVEELFMLPSNTNVFDLKNLLNFLYTK